jgi:hypothetical protein
MADQHKTFCPLCERETDVPIADVQSPTIPPFMPNDYVLVEILRSRGHACDPADLASVRLADLIKAIG